MTERLQVYRCNVCGNIVEVMHAGVGTLVCCGQPMELLKEKTQDVGNEKHVPVVEKIKQGIRVRVGSVPHPMEEKHYIEWVEVITKSGGSQIAFLKPGMEPEADFKIKIEDVATVREYCNIHGLWKAEME
ncbi:MAG: desulfoferrodoxin [Candidatus Anstonellales archaeon]